MRGQSGCQQRKPPVSCILGILNERKKKTFLINTLKKVYVAQFSALLKLDNEEVMS